jgi:hypothetical protein
MVVHPPLAVGTAAFGKLDALMKRTRDIIQEGLDREEW